ncbi:MAG TPA: hypothetical protein VL490_11670 [Mucilaginibacter sp.]|jgi:hypothetical protein|nr:hypothetical protein [Mucilaginibacter sp.]
MKNILSLIIIALICFTGITYSQTPKPSNRINYDDLFLVYKQTHIKVAAINPKNIVSLLGKPFQIKTEQSKMSNAMITTYYYHYFGEVYFEKDQLTGIDIRNKAWAFIFKINNKMSLPYTMGSDITPLKTLFPQSWANRHDNLMHVFIGNSDTSVVFEIKGDRIINLNLFSDES